MKRSLHIGTVLLFAIGASLLEHRATAQDPDIRDIRPVVMLLMDTSGSMEFTPGCTCTSADCSECYPTCLINPADEQNRWAIVLQALTGEWTPFFCIGPTARNHAFMLGDYDEGYFLPHFFLPHVVAGLQDSNGILDNYVDRIKFGLMTFDGVGTLLGELPLVTQTDFLTVPFPTDSAGAAGMFSYGGSKPFTFPSAVDTYMIDIGARGEPVAAGGNATEGGLISVGADADVTTTNGTVQSTILGGPDAIPDLRPFGATPTAGMMEDLRYYLQDHSDVIEKTVDPGPGDSYYACRTRSAILITDGLPNADMRDDPVNCQDLGTPVGATGCPYDATEQIVQDMIDDEELDSVYVVAFELDDAGEQASLALDLNELAALGGTGEAVFVTDRDSMYAAISAILDELNPGATSRTAPVPTGSSPGLEHAEFFSGFNPSSDITDPWDGILEKKRIECVDGVPVEREIEERDKFQEVLNDQSSRPGDVEPFSSDVGVSFSGFSRNLWTVLPTDPNDIDEALAGSGQQKLVDDSLFVPPTGTPTYIRDVEPAAFDLAIAETYFGVATTAERDDIVNFVHGESGTAREDQRLGAIYHSTPVIVGPISTDIQDESYNQWRRGFDFQRSPDPDEDLSTAGWVLFARPRVIYAATNDGILHAFLADDHDVNTVLDEFECADGEDAGTELWGFIPPILLDDLKDLDDGGLDLLLDGDIVVRNLLDFRQIGSTSGGNTKPNVWRTVLFMGLRSGGRAIFALDVTNPCKPEFLWQFAGDVDLGDTYGRPAAGQVVLDSTTYNPSGERGIIIVPGGNGTVEDITTADTPVAPAVADSIEWSDNTSVGYRMTRRLWCDTGSTAGDCTGGPSGRALYVLDLITGEVLRKFGESTFPAPLNGGVSVYRGNTGALTSAAYTVDADGMLWRIDLSDPDPDDWWAVALHDIFHDGVFDTAASSRSYNPPVLSTDAAGNVVILHGTGNIDVFDDATAVNKVFSLTEELHFDVTDGSIDDITGTLGWEITLNPGELVTGPLELFAGRLFWGTYQATGPSAVNSCPLEGSRIWGVSYLEDPENARDPAPRLTNAIGDDVTNLDKDDIPELETTLVMGLQVAQQPDCTVTTTLMITDPFLGLRSLPVPSNTSARSFRLMAHLSGGKTGGGGGLSLDVLNEDMPQLVSQTLIADFIESTE